MIFLLLKIAGVWLFLVAILLRGNHRAHRRKMLSAEEPKLPINHIYYANRYGVFRYEGEEMRRFAAELEQRQGGEL